MAMSCPYNPRRLDRAMVWLPCHFSFHSPSGLGLPVIDKRPVNLDLGTIKFPITALVSIAHRVSGVALIGAMLVLLFLFGHSLKSAEAFAQVQVWMGSLPVKLLVWAILAALIYHMLAGIKHLIMDAGIGETLEGGKIGATIVIGLTVLGVLLAGVWVW